MGRDVKTMSKINFPAKGQINLDSKFGSFLYNFIKEEKIKKVLETGTWNGYGSTRILYEALKDEENPFLISFETDPLWVKETKKLYSPVDWVNIVHGSIIKKEEFFTSGLDNIRSGWLQEDYERYDTCMFYDIKDLDIELALLDSSEFGGFAEFKRIEKKCQYAVLDDTGTLKHKKTRKYCLEKYICIEDHPNDRNGWSIFELKEK
jgi:hypothetical protein